MRTRFWTLLIVAACGGQSSQTSSEEVEEAASGVEVSKAAVASFCSFMDTFSPMSLQGVPMADRQAEVAKRQRDAALAAGVKDWDAFAAFMDGSRPDQRSQQLEKLIQQHGLQSECLVARHPDVLTDAERVAQNKRITEIVARAAVARSQPAGASISKAALAHYCDFVDSFDPASVRDVPPTDLQTVLTERMGQAASDAGVADWAEFEVFLRDTPPDLKQALLETSIQEHGLQLACLAVRDPAVLTDAERAAFEKRSAEKLGAPR